MAAHAPTAPGARTVSAREYRRALWLALGTGLLFGFGLGIALCNIPA